MDYKGKNLDTEVINKISGTGNGDLTARDIDHVIVDLPEEKESKFSIVKTFKSVMKQAANIKTICLGVGTSEKNKILEAKTGNRPPTSTEGKDGNYDVKLIGTDVFNPKTSEKDQTQQPKSKDKLPNMIDPTGIGLDATEVYNPKAKDEKNKLERRTLPGVGIDKTEEFDERAYRIQTADNTEELFPKDDKEDDRDDIFSDGEH